MDESLRRLKRQADSGDPSAQQAYYMALWRSGDTSTLHYLDRIHRAPGIIEFFDSLVPQLVQASIDAPETNLPKLAWITVRTNRRIPGIYPWYYWQCVACHGASDHYIEIENCCALDHSFQAVGQFDPISYRDELLAEQEQQEFPFDYDSDKDWREGKRKFHEWPEWARTYCQAQKFRQTNRRNPDDTRSALVKNFLSSQDPTVLDQFLREWARSPDINSMLRLASGWTNPSPEAFKKVETTFREYIHEPMWEAGRQFYTLDDETDKTTHAWTPAFWAWRKPYDEACEVIIRLYEAKKVFILEDAEVFPHEELFPHYPSRSPNYLELHSNHTLAEINRPVNVADGIFEAEYWDQRHSVMQEFEILTKVSIAQLGRSGRHIVVADDENNRLAYPYLKKLALQLEEKLINTMNEFVGYPQAPEEVEEDGDE